MAKDNIEPTNHPNLSFPDSLHLLEVAMRGELSLSPGVASSSSCIVLHRPAIVDPACTLNFLNQNVTHLANNRDLTIPHSCSSDPSPLHTPVQPQCSNRRSCLQRRQLPQHQSWKRNNWIVFRGSHWILQINRNSRKSVNSGRRSGRPLGLDFMPDVYSVQPLCQVGQTPSHVRILRSEMRLWGCTWVRGTGYWVLYFAEIREGCSDKVPV
jgi:hypothetical protein